MRKLKLEELGRISLEEFKKQKKIPVIIILDNIRSMHNVGSAFRTADAFLIDKLYLCGITATPPQREIRKTALGAEDSVDWEYCENPLKLVSSLQSEGYTIISVEQVEESVDLNDFKPDLNKKYALVYGNEVEGVSQKIVDSSDLCLEIPQFGSKHSLNVSVSIGVTIWPFSSAFNK